jgi:phosphoribosylanthranilate isomerase
MYGGTGKTADWGLARQLAQTCPIILAGGLRPDNVVEALQEVDPWGVDVASGVESAPGVKDMQKVAAFVQAVRSYTRETAP